MTETLLDISTTSLKMNNNDRKQIYEVFKQGLDELQSFEYSPKEKFDLIKRCYSDYHQIVKKLIKL